MKLLETDRKDGYARIGIENEDDLWYLKDVIGEGDRVRALTQRTKIDGREKKTLKLTLEAEKVELQDDRLRVTGEMVRGDEEVEQGYHTFNLEPGDEFEIWGDFTSRNWDRLEEAESKRSYEVLFCLVEKGKADLFLVRESGITDLSALEENIPGKLYSDQKTGEAFYQEIKNVLVRSEEDVDSMVLAGPGFEKQKVYDILPEELQGKTFVEDTSVTGKTGLNEAIKRGALKKVVEDSRISEESDSLEEFFEEVERDGNASYGNPVEELAEQGAVEKLLITREEFRERQGLVKSVEHAGGEVQVIHTDHEAGERLENLGGVAAILRYKP